MLKFVKWYNHVIIFHSTYSTKIYISLHGVGGDGLDIMQRKSAPTARIKCKKEVEKNRKKSVSVEHLAKASERGKLESRDGRDEEKRNWLKEHLQSSQLDDWHWISVSWVVSDSSYTGNKFLFFLLQIACCSTWFLLSSLLVSSLNILTLPALQFSSFVSVFY